MDINNLTTTIRRKLFPSSVIDNIVRIIMIIMVMMIIIIIIIIIRRRRRRRRRRRKRKFIVIKIAFDKVLAFRGCARSTSGSQELAVLRNDTLIAIFSAANKNTNKATVALASCDSSRENFGFNLTRNGLFCSK